ncbi:MAG: HAD family hydrolase [Leptolyngbyaceae cyanobacterium HOT.MB2.61]|jgi:phosphoglycolate phosphatase|nr:HAD family hydrolase [Leptolyngbyaceae cyanobacterium HOT.MB2.61]
MTFLATIQCGTVCFKHLQAILFDKDGTLANSHDFLWNLGQKRARLIDAQIPGVQEPLLMAFGLNGPTLNPAGLMAVGSRLENEIAAAAYIAEMGRDWVEARTIARSAFQEADRVFKRKADHTPLFEGAISLLRSLAKAQVKVGILSADTTANVQDFIERYELGALVSSGVGTDAGPGKPDPTLFYRACAELGVEPKATLAIGDSAADGEMARAAGAAGWIGVTWGWTEPFSLQGADTLATHFADIQVFDEAA